MPRFLVTVNEYIPDGVGLGCYGYFNLPDEIFEERLSWENIEKAATSEISALLTDMFKAIRDKKRFG